MLAHVRPPPTRDLREGVRWVKERAPTCCWSALRPILGCTTTGGFGRPGGDPQVANEENVFYCAARSRAVPAPQTNRVDQGDNPFPPKPADECMAAQSAQALAANMVLRRTRRSRQRRDRP